MARVGQAGDSVWRAARSAPGEARGHTSNRPVRRGRGFRALLLAGGLSGVGASALAGQAASTLPTGGRVAQGGASISAGGSASAPVLTITQSTPRAVIDWQSFNIGSAATVDILEPGAASVQLDRVVGGNASEIDGHLNANGQVFLINPAGILFGQGAQLNVGGLVASTMALADSAFMSGTYAFARNGSTGTVTNQGSIGAASYVALLAPNLVNEGAITVGRMGSVALAAGEAVTLTTDGGLALEVQPATVATLVANKAMIAAPDGTVILTAKALDALTAQVINSGSIDVGDTIATGNGGTVTLISSGETRVTGSILARGGSDGGNGGSIETSGAVLDIGGATIDAGAPKGKGGSWLLDPYDLTVDAVAALTLDLALNGGTNVTLTTSATGASGPGLTNAAGNGDIIIASAVNWASAASLTLSAYRNISVDAAVGDSVAGNVVLRADNSGTDVGSVVFGAGGSVSTGGAVSLYYDPAGGYAKPSAFPNVTAGGGLAAYMLVNDATGLGNVAGNLSGTYALGANITLSSGNFAPIGNGTTPFAGLFDGNGDTISGLTISANSNDLGLFGVIGSGATVRNLNLAGASISGQSYLGLLAGISYGTISNVSAAGTVSGGQAGDYIGGLIGYSSGLVTAGFASATVNAGSGAGYIGGLVGASTGGAIIGSGASGAVNGGSANYDIGGLVGKNLTTVQSSYATGSVGGIKGSYQIGGLAGLNSGVVAASYATGTVFGDANTNYIGGLVGQNAGTISASYATGSISGGSANGYLGGLVGLNAGSVLGSFASGLVNGGTFSYELGGLAGASSGLVSGSYATGSVTGGGGSFDIGGLAGENNGGAILASYATGLVNDGSVNSKVGGLVGFNYAGTIADSYATGAVIGSTGSSAIGGLVGENFEGSVSASYASGAVSGASRSYELGGLVGFNEGTIAASNASGSVNGATTSYDIGGLVGENYLGTIASSYATGMVTAAGGTSNLGGLVGYNLQAAIAASYATGGVTGGGSVGGLVGTNYLATITTSYATGTVGGLSGSVAVGGLAGTNSGTISASYATGTVAGGSKNQDVGGLVGYNNVMGVVSAAYASGQVTGGSGSGAVGGAIGNNASTAASVYWDIDTSGQTAGVGTGGVTGVSGIYSSSGSSPSAYQSATYAGFDFAGTWYMINGSTRPFLQAEYSTTITNAHQLQLMAMNPGATYTLAGNIDLSAETQAAQMWSGAGFVPVGNSATPFTGELLGQGFTIGNLFIDQPGGGSLGLFGVNSGLLENFSLGNVTVSGASSVGGLAGQNRGGTIIDVAVSGSLVASGAAASFGGLVGYNTGTISASGADVTLAVGSASNNVGGLVGYNLGGAVIGDISSGSVSVAGSASGPHAAQIGGLIGENTGTVTASSSSVAVSAGSNSYYVGGAIGLNNGTVSGTFATGAVSAGGGAVQVGGLLGGNGSGTVAASWAAAVVSAGSGSVDVGGFAGSNWGTLTSDMADGTVSVGPATRLVGGLVGENGAVIVNSYAEGSLTVASGTGSQYVGGLVGYQTAAGSLTDSYAAVTISAGTAVASKGGLVGATATGSHVAASFWDKQVSGLTASAGGTGLLTSQLLQEATFTLAGWDFGATWSFSAGAAYPILQAISYPPAPTP